MAKDRKEKSLIVVALKIIFIISGIIAVGLGFVFRDIYRKDLNWQKKVEEKKNSFFWKIFLPPSAIGGQVHSTGFRNIMDMVHWSLPITTIITMIVIIMDFIGIDLFTMPEANYIGTLISFAFISWIYGIIALIVNKFLYR